MSLVEGRLALSVIVQDREISVPTSLIVRQWEQVRKQVWRLWSLRKPVEFEEAWQSHATIPNPEFYSNFSQEFNATFFLKNLLKCLIAREIMRIQGFVVRRDVFDLGCGAGPFALALLLGNRRDQSFTLFDNSSSQLKLAGSLLDNFDPDRRCTLVRAKIPRDVRLGAGTPVASYLLSELPDFGEGLLNPGGSLDRQVAIVDDPGLIRSVAATLAKDLNFSTFFVMFTFQGLPQGAAQNESGEFGLFLRCS